MDKRWVWLAALAAGAVGQSLAPTNSTAEEGEGEGPVGLQVSIGDEMVPLAPVVALTSEGRSGIPPTGLSGPARLAGVDSYNEIESGEVTFISCDEGDYYGQVDASTVFSQAVDVDVKAIVLYSQTSDSCELDDYSGSFSSIYSMGNEDDTKRLLDKFDGTSDQVWATLGADGPGNGTAPSPPPPPGEDNDDDDNAAQGTPGFDSPQPSTAVAMIILYSITGIITALFLIIIVTGALRAHRHPERYGPRNIIGRPRQSRAKGLARAMLETLPIVKVGDDREAPKPTDVELGENPRSDTREEAEAQSPTSETTEEENTSQTSPPQEQQNESHTSADDNGIAAATTSTNDPTTKRNNLGCSICTEDFITGEDQRVLPCDHRFHPACVDPWLLNVSGTCPLCRIDLQPSDPAAETDEHGNPVILREGEFDPAPPNDAETQQRMSIRRSLLIGIMGIGGGARSPDRMTRAERVMALREMRAQELTMQRRAQQPQPQNEEEEEQRSARQRLRRVFGGRRTTEQPVEETRDPRRDRPLTLAEQGGSPEN